jgi:hypothetical protein
MGFLRSFSRICVRLVLQATDNPDKVRPVEGDSSNNNKSTWLCCKFEPQYLADEIGCLVHTSSWRLTGARFDQPLQTTSRWMSRATDHSECGHQLYASRPERHLNLVYGMVHNSFDYASHLYEALLSKLETCVARGALSPAIWTRSRSSLAAATQFGSRHSRRDYQLYVRMAPKIEGAGGGGCSPFGVNVNGFGRFEPANCGRPKQAALAGHQRLDKRLVTGRRTIFGRQSELARRAAIESGRRDSTRPAWGEAPRATSSGCKVSVPRALLITNRANELWLRSSNEQFDTRIRLVQRQLAARSASQTNLMARGHVGLVEGQRLMSARCQQTQARLVECLLPDCLMRQLRDALIEMFGERAFDDDSAGPLKPFAVRSSEAGEDVRDLGGRPDAHHPGRARARLHLPARGRVLDEPQVLVAGAPQDAQSKLN